MVHRLARTDAGNGAGRQRGKRGQDRAAYVEHLDSVTPLGPFSFETVVEANQGVEVLAFGHGGVEDSHQIDIALARVEAAGG